jgi:hypothetical protein
MIVRQDFKLHGKLPPRGFLEQIMNPESKTYCFLWDRKDRQNRFKMDWKALSRYYQKNHFRTVLRKLNTEGLLDYEETDEGISVELVGWEDVE